VEDRARTKPPVLVGAAVLLVGFIAFLCAILVTKNSPPPEIPESLTTTVAVLEQDLASEEARLAQNRKEKIRVEAVLSERSTEKARLTGRVEARRIELKRLEKTRDAKADAAQQQVHETQTKAEEELQQALKTEAKLKDEALTQAQLEKTLRLSRYNVVQILSLDQRASLGSGFFLNEDGLRNEPWVVTTERVVPADGLIFVRVTALPDRRNVERQISVRARASYRDKETGLVFLKLLSVPRLSIKSYTPKSFGDVSVGDRVYAIGMQGVVGGMLDNSVMEGSVSALSREFENRDYLQLDLPANFGSSGATVISRKGTLTGVLVAPLEGLERTSVAVSAKELKNAIDRCAGRAPRGNPGRPGNRDVPAQNQVGRFPPAPYDLDKTIPHEAPRSLPTRRAGMGVFPGPDDLLIIEDTAGKKHVAYSSKDLKKPVWSQVWGNSTCTWMIPTDAPDRGLLLHHKAGVSTVSEVDLRTGRSRKSWRWSDGSIDSSFACTQQAIQMNGCVFCPGRSCYVFDHTSRQCYRFPDHIARPLCKNGSDLWLTRRGRTGLQLVAIPLSRLVTFIRQKAALERLGRTNPDANSQAVRLANTLQTAGRVLANVTVYEDRCGPHALCLPNKRVLISGDSVFDLSRGTPGAKLEIPRHSRADAVVSFATKLATLKTLRRTMGHVMDVSPDGRWLLLPGHLVDAATLKPVAELPMLCLEAGFLSNSKTIYFVDRIRKKIGFISVDELQKKAKAGEAEKP